MTDIDPTEPFTPVEVTKRKIVLWPWPLPAWTGVAGIAVGAVLALAIIGIANAVGSATSNTFQPVLAACSLTDNSDSQIGDNGKSLTINSKGTDDATGLSLTEFDCVMAELKTPDSVMAHVSQTSSLDGRQTETWGDLSMSWTYHPSRGLDAVYTVVK